MLPYTLPRKLNFCGRFDTPFTQKSRKVDDSILFSLTLYTLYRCMGFFSSNKPELRIPDLGHGMANATNVLRSRFVSIRDCLSSCPETGTRHAALASLHEVLIYVLYRFFIVEVRERQGTRTGCIQQPRQRDFTSRPSNKCWTRCLSFRARRCEQIFWQGFWEKSQGKHSRYQFYAHGFGSHPIHFLPSSPWPKTWFPSFAPTEQQNECGYNHVGSFFPVFATW